MKVIALVLAASAALVSLPAFAAATSTTTTSTAITGAGLSANCDNTSTCAFPALPSTQNLLIEGVTAICSPAVGYGGTITFNNNAFLQFTPPNGTSAIRMPLYPSNPLPPTNTSSGPWNFIFPVKAYAKAGTVITVSLPPAVCSAQIIGQTY